MFGSTPEGDTLESRDYNDYPNVCVFAPHSKRLARDGWSSDFSNEDLNGVGGVAVPANRMTRTVRGRLRVSSATCDLNINDGIRACGDGHVVEVVSRFGGKHAENPFER